MSIEQLAKFGQRIVLAAELLWLPIPWTWRGYWDTEAAVTAWRLAWKELAQTKAS